MMEMSKEYGTALFMLAKENGAEEEYDTALHTVLSAFEENAMYVDFLASPSIPLRERTDAVEQAFGGAVPEHIISFVQILCEGGRIRGFSDCVKVYRELFQVSRHVSTAKVISSVALTETEEQQIREKLEKMSGNSVMLECSVDSSLIGGVVIEMDGKVMDGSLRRRLYEVKEVISR